MKLGPSTREFRCGRETSAATRAGLHAIRQIDSALIEMVLKEELRVQPDAHGQASSLGP